MWSQTFSWGSATAGGISNSPRDSFDPAVALTSQGYPVVTWSDKTPEYYGGGVVNIYIRVWNGQIWTDLEPRSAALAGISYESGHSSDSDLVVDASDRPIVCWREGMNNDREIYVRRFNGTAWENVGTQSGGQGSMGISQSTGYSHGPALTLNALGNSAAAWADQETGIFETYVRAFNGVDTWDELGTSSATPNGISNTAADSTEVAIGRSGNGDLVVAWSQAQANGTYSEIYVKRYDGASWVQIGTSSAQGNGISNSTAHSHAPTLTLDANNDLVVAWHDGLFGDGKIKVRRYNGVNWLGLESGTATADTLSVPDNNTARYPAAARGQDGNPVIAWDDNSTGAYDTYVLHFNGTVWEELGSGSATGSGISGVSHASIDTKPDLASDSAGNLVAVFEAGVQIWAKYFDGVAWREYGSRSAVGLTGASDSAAPARAPVLRLTPDDIPFLAWQDGYSGAGEILLRRFDGNAWVDVGSGSGTGGGISNNAGDSRSPAMVLSAGNPVVAWQDDTAGNTEIYVRRYDGAAWQEIGAGSSSGPGISNTTGASTLPAIAVASDGTPVVAWQDDSSGNNEICVARFNDPAWDPMGNDCVSAGGLSNNAGSSESPVIVMDANDNPVVAWHDDTSGDFEIYMRRHDGSVWQDVGTSSAAAGGVSNNTGSSQFPSLVLVSANRPVVAWQDDTSGRWQIYALAFEGVGWAELDSDSAFGSGVSQSDGHAMRPSLSTDGSGSLALAWEDDASGEHQIYARRFDGSAWQELTTGSVADGGISNSMTWSQTPSLAQGTNLKCAAWAEPGPVQQILVRCSQ